MKKLKKNPKLQLEKFSTIFTQLGLVLVLFVVFVSLEYESKVKEEVASKDYEKTERILDFTELPMLIKKEEVVVKKEILKKEVVLEKKIEIIKKEEKKIIEEVIIKPTDPEDKTDFIETLTTATEDNIDDDDDPKPISIKSVQKAPVFKGCEGLSERENRVCFEKKMKKLVQRHFDTELANELGLRSGKKRISTQFVIDESGNVIDIQIRAPHPRLKKEANRIINKIPTFKPGYQNDKPAKVRYTLPISFMVE